MIGLPPEGTALARELGGYAARYSTEAHAATRNGNLLAELVWLGYETNRDPKKSKPIPKPEQVDLSVPPPERKPSAERTRKPEQKKRRVETDHDKIMAFFGQPTKAEGQVVGSAGREPRVPVGTVSNPT